ncbi:MAG TPA: helix-turn-helix domain-containing protein, partial [Acidimicrobiales bacterium]|nr:helix-turn-helix domain-containing protein [Acidimicrobiales bacterium]
MAALMINAAMNDLPESTAELDDTLLALADPTRRRVVDLLRGGPQRASDIADGVGMSRQATSRHLNHLRDRGILAVDLV